MGSSNGVAMPARSRYAGPPSTNPRRHQLITKDDLNRFAVRMTGISAVIAAVALVIAKLVI